LFAEVLRLRRKGFAERESRPVWEENPGSRYHCPVSRWSGLSERSPAKEEKKKGKKNHFLKRPLSSEGRKARLLVAIYGRKSGLGSVHGGTVGAKGEEGKERRRGNRFLSASESD